MGNLTDKKEIAVAFLKLAATGKVSEAFEKYVSKQDFRHHNPHFPGDAKSLRSAMMEAHQKFPDTSIEVHHVFEDEDLVAVHSRVTHSVNKPSIAVVHIVRIDERNRIAELWDVAMEEPKDSPNENGMF